MQNLTGHGPTCPVRLPGGPGYARASYFRPGPPTGPVPCTETRNRHPLVASKVMWALMLYRSPPTGGSMAGPRSSLNASTMLAVVSTIRCSVGTNSWVARAVSCGKKSFNSLGLVGSPMILGTGWRFPAGPMSMMGVPNVIALIISRLCLSRIVFFRCNNVQMLWIAAQRRFTKVIGVPTLFYSPPREKHRNSVREFEPVFVPTPPVPLVTDPWPNPAASFLETTRSEEH